MIKDNDCFFCSKDQRLDDRMIKIKELKCSTLFLYREQNYQGRCIVALDEHRIELFEIDQQKLACFMDDVAAAAHAVHAAFSPDKINYAVYGDLVSHVHFHIVPKYKDGPDWGVAFVNSPDEKVYLTDAGYSEMISKIKDHL